MGAAAAAALPRLRQTSTFKGIYKWLTATRIRRAACTIGVAVWVVPVHLVSGGAAEPLKDHMVVSWIVRDGKPKTGVLDVLYYILTSLRLLL